MKNGLTVRTPVSDLSLFRDDFFFPLEQQFDKFFRDFFKDSTLDAVRANGGYPKIDVFEDGEFWGVKAAVPGVRAEDLSVEVLPAVDKTTGTSPPVVRISGQMNTEYREENENTKLVYRELHKSRFRRDVSLPDYIEGEPDAQLKDGILTLKWKHQIKKPPESKKITIKTE